MITPFVLFEFIQIVVQTFQRFIDDVTRGPEGIFVCIDILVASTLSTSHPRALFSRLQEADVVINAGNCVFGATSLAFVGHTTSGDIIPSQEKVYLQPCSCDPSRRRGTSIEQFCYCLDRRPEFAPKTSSSGRFLRLSTPIHPALRLTPFCRRLPRALQHQGHLASHLQ
ncbi:uncharacterized protein LOC122257242 [Penaeus japonicus]|uniref:uncharacterized protein LOC122257242 n=1 Tax=Penaeus japonicus TaxID=27405 RepID=UPI001C7131CB|nr:uncharacterized protein LOC122257242 [Penaeus japonicus]XP_042878346.1 uncharacterized protein LOC122257242 [Penaeus japonicus]